MVFGFGLLAGILVSSSPTVRQWWKQVFAEPPAPAVARPVASAPHRSARRSRPAEPVAKAIESPAPRHVLPPSTAPGTVRLALVIDDLGRSLTDLTTLHALGIPVTYAVLPYESQTGAVAAALHRSGDEVLCHLPMEPKSGGNPGPGALRLGMSDEELRAATVRALEAVPGAVGVNNHMGSFLSASKPAMATILGVLASRRLFFLDSRTSAQSVGFRVATSLGVPAAERQVFLDDDLASAAVRAQFEHLLELGRERGEAIAIGHPHPDTLSVLAEEVPRARALGYQFVRVSELLSRPAALDAPRQAARN